MVNCAGGFGTERARQHLLERARADERRRAVGARCQVLGDAAVGRQIASGNRLDRVQCFIAEHDRNRSELRLSPRSSPSTPNVRHFKSVSSIRRSCCFARYSWVFTVPSGSGERLRQVLVLHALEVVRRDEQPIVRRQSRDRFLEPIPQLEIAELPIGRRRRPRPRALVVERQGRGARPWSCTQTLATMR